MNASHAASPVDRGRLVLGRSVLLAIAIGLVTATACIDESLVENKDCKSDADCFNSQECLLTGYQANLPDPTGWCRSDGEECVEGEQPGCACEIDGVQQCCSGTLDAPLAPFVHPDEGCICVLPDDTTFPTDDTTINGCIPV